MTDKIAERQRQRRRQRTIAHGNLQRDIDVVLNTIEGRRLLKRILTLESWQPGCPDSANLLFYQKGHMDTFMQIKNLFNVAQLRIIADEELKDE